MSTSIPYGLRLTTHAPNLYDLTRLISTAIRQRYHAKAREIIAKHVVAILDDPAARKTAVAYPHEDQLNFRARRRWLDEQSQFKDDVLNDQLGFTIVFAEAHDKYGNHYRMANVVTGGALYHNTLLDLKHHDAPAFVDFSYQNLADQPNDVSSAQWEIRRTLWEEVTSSDDLETAGTFGHLPGWYLPEAEQNVFHEAVISLRGGNKPLDLNTVISPETRLTTLIHRAVQDDPRMEQQHRDLDFLDRLYSIAQLRLDIEAYLGSPAGQALPRPEPIPLQLDAHLSTLPPPYTVQPATIDTIVALLRTKH